MLNDESMYGAETEKFKPERWLTPDGKLNSAMQDPDMAFGFGRRICPGVLSNRSLLSTSQIARHFVTGKDMAQSSIWITVSSILATFNLEKAVDDGGVTIEPSGEYTSGMLW